MQTSRRRRGCGSGLNQTRGAVGPGGRTALADTELAEGALEIEFLLFSIFSFTVKKLSSHADEPSAPGAWLSDLIDGDLSGLVAKPLAGTELAEGALET